MKKIGKISINPEKVIKNEELVNLRGGYLFDCYCYDTWDNFQIDVVDAEELHDWVNQICEYGGTCEPC